jgi:NTP pyrophosphatase (non-canonical NTP hydrolase)
MSAYFVSFRKLRTACLARWREWMGADPSEVTLIFTTNELAGECGEACNVAKKIERARLGVVGGISGQAAREKLAEELADVVICAQNVALMCRIDLSESLVEKFNKTSVEKGLKTMFEVGVLDGIEVIAAERIRQIAQKGFTDEHDDEHRLGELTDAAMCFNLAGDGMSLRGWTQEEARREMLAFCWPWEDQWCKPAPTAIGNYAKAGALIAAEIDRQKRMQAKGGAS